MMLPYSLNLVKTFTVDDTYDLTSQNYYYDLQLVSGTDTLSYLRSLAETVGINSTYMNIQTVYDRLLAKNVVLPKDFSITQPIGTIDMSIPLLSNGKIQVINYLQGDLR